MTQGSHLDVQRKHAITHDRIRLAAFLGEPLRRLEWPMRSRPFTLEVRIPVTAHFESVPVPPVVR